MSVGKCQVFPSVTYIPAMWGGGGGGLSGGTAIHRSQVPSFPSERGGGYSDDPRI